jgi:tetratricopeptide (TPR) repeat protein
VISWVQALCREASELAESRRLWEAVERYNQAIVANPTDAEVVRSKAVLLQRAGHHPSATTVFDRALELEPGDAGTHYLAAATACALGDATRVYHHLRCAVRVEPSLRFELASDDRFRPMWGLPDFKQLTRGGSYRG